MVMGHDVGMRHGYRTWCGYGLWLWGTAMGPGVAVGPGVLCPQMGSALVLLCTAAVLLKGRKSQGRVGQELGFSLGRKTGKQPNAAWGAAAASEPRRRSCEMGAAWDVGAPLCAPCVGPMAAGLLGSLPAQLFWGSVMLFRFLPTQPPDGSVICGAPPTQRCWFQLGGPFYPNHPMVP